MNLVVSTSLGRLRDWTGHGVSDLQFVEGKIAYELVVHQCNWFIDKICRFASSRTANDLQRQLYSM